MSLARAFTTRRAKPSFDLKESNTPQRSNTTAKRHGYTGSIRNKISAPTELTHTTNMLAYNAPDLHPKTPSSTTSSKASDDESDGNQTSASSPPTSPDIPSADDKSISTEPNHLSCYFTAPGQQLPVVKSQPPKIPQRAPSHTKKASLDNLARQHSLRQSSQSGSSISSKASYSLSRSSSTSTTATSVSSMSFSRSKAQIPEVPEIPAIPAEPMVTAPAPSRQLSQRRADMPSTHPFGKELAQVSEIAEEFGIKDKLHVVDEEEQDLVRKGLCRLRAEDYLTEVQSLFATFFAPEPAKVQPVWI
ncbi:hypothetical protein SUNI508_05592 [Seiridium unicorne]|uniref:Uncharacterized protein n=1 Tax=Seiridium unicorne TaxID=138068 RepID=A0ABR2V437_9PEZI